MPDVNFNAAAAPIRSGAGKPRLWFLAALPPPVDGQKVCNLAMLRLLRSDWKACEPVVLALGPSTTSKIARAVVNSMILMFRARSCDKAYMSIPGQLGAWLLLPMVIALRLRGVQMWFHHHSFRSINLGPLKAMRALVLCAGSRQNHILLSNGMRDRFAAIYLSDQGSAHALSNTCLFPPDTIASPGTRPERPPTLGHMSVLTRAKGVFHLIKMFDELAATVPGIRLVLAGPARDPEIRNAIAAAAARHPAAFEYRGEIGDASKDQFYRDIDLFVLPTTLIDEAEPLVMIEAYAQGVDVFATATGCIPDRLRDPSRTLSLNVAADADRVAGATHLNGSQWMALRDECRRHIKRLSEDSDRQSAAIFSLLRSAPLPQSAKCHEGVTNK